MKESGLAARQALIGQTRDLLMRRRVDEAEQLLLGARGDKIAATSICWSCWQSSTNRRSAPMTLRAR